MIHSPEAYDPQIQEKIDQLTEHPDKYLVEFEMSRQQDFLENRRREIRALQKECERTELTIFALQKALDHIHGKPKQLKDDYKKI